MKLYLPMKRVWFDLTAQGIKTEDYRDITPYWIKRLFTEPDMFELLKNSCIECKFREDTPWTSDDFMCGANRNLPLPRNKICHINKFQWANHYFKQFDSVVEHIYGHVEPIEYEFKGITIGEGREEWGAEKGVKYFIIHLGNKIN